MQRERYRSLSERMRELTRVKAGLNDYRYVASLCIQHPTMDADFISRAIPFVPKRICNVGERKRDPRGKLREGVYDGTYWTAKLQTPANNDVSEFLWLLNEQLAPCREFLTKLSSSGGKTEVLFGLFADRCCDFALPASLLANLASAGIGLRLDYYGPEVA